jgi:hypothetical protein
MIVSPYVTRQKCVDSAIQRLGQSHSPCTAKCRHSLYHIPQPPQSGSQTLARPRCFVTNERPITSPRSQQPHLHAVLLHWRLQPDDLRQPRYRPSPLNPPSLKGKGEARRQHLPFPPALGQGRGRGMGEVAGHAVPDSPPEHSGKPRRRLGPAPQHWTTLSFAPRTSRAPWGRSPRRDTRDGVRVLPLTTAASARRTSPPPALGR